MEDTATPPAVTNQIQPPAETQSTQNTSYRYAGFWVRVVASIIDAIVVGIIGYIIQQIIGKSDAISIVIGAAYHIGMWIKYDGMTLGKKAMGIKVIQTNGQPLDLKTAIIRYVGYMVSGIALGIGFIWAAFDKQKQGWHDKIASTYVIYK